MKKILFAVGLLSSNAFITDSGYTTEAETNRMLGLFTQEIVDTA